MCIRDRLDRELRGGHKGLRGDPSSGGGLGHNGEGPAGPGGEIIHVAPGASGTGGRDRDLPRPSEDSKDRDGERATRGKTSGRRDESAESVTHPKAARSRVRSKERLDKARRPTRRGEKTPQKRQPDAVVALRQVSGGAGHHGASGRGHSKVPGQAPGLAVGALGRVGQGGIPGRPPRFDLAKAEASPQSL